MRLPVSVLVACRLFAGVLVACAIPAVANAASATDPRIEPLLTALGKVHGIDAVQLSPDGTRLAWVVDANDQSAIYIGTADGSDARLLEPSRRHAACSESDIAWAPDSHRLAYLSDCAADAKGQKDVFIADVGNGNAGNTRSQRIGRLHGIAQSLRWSGDGKALAFLY